MNNINKKVGRPVGSKSTTAFSLQVIYQKFGPFCCPPISTVWLKENGLINDVKVEHELPKSLTVEPKSSIKIVNFDKE
jgi:hypothetical protein